MSKDMKDGWFVKRPIPIYAVRQREPFQVHTLEGVMKGDAGDWLITGAQREQYPIKDAIFRQTYRALPPCDLCGHAEPHDHYKDVDKVGYGTCRRCPCVQPLEDA